MTPAQTLRIREMARGPLYSVPRLAGDIALWALLVAWAETVGTPWLIALVVVIIGAIPFHDILVHGHEGTHRHLARTRWLNELFNWFGHALIGLSGTAYRAFHLAHHRWAQTGRDPEYQLLDRIARGAPGWSYLAIPAVAHVLVNTYPLRAGYGRRVIGNVARDLAGMALLHAALAAGLGLRRYVTFVIAPIFTGLAAAVVLRSLCEHHGTPAGDSWTNTRTMNAGRVLDLLWSNTSYHLEHHLFPFVPFHKLPAVRALLHAEMRDRGSAIDEGFWRNALALLRHPRHFEPQRPFAPAPRGPRAFVETGTIAFRMKVRWFLDLLAHPEARRHLWSLYYAGEAYVELHPDGVFVDRLEPRLGRLLRRHLEDETRHATVFRRLLADEGAAPVPLPPPEDVGFFLLSTVLPDIGAELGRHAPFSPDLTQRYMAFLHTLELRSLGDLHALIAACRRRGEEALAVRFEAIARDERFHASYTHRAVWDLAPDRGQARRVLDAVRRAERRNYRTVLLAILRRFESLGARPRDLGGRLRWTAMRWLAQLGLAVPLLPLFETLPPHLVSE
jgi:fatty acid desaturase